MLYAEEPRGEKTQRKPKFFLYQPYLGLEIPRAFALCTAVGESKWLLFLFQKGIRTVRSIFQNIFPGGCHRDEACALLLNSHSSEINQTELTEQKGTLKRPQRSQPKEGNKIGLKAFLNQRQGCHDLIWT